MKKIAPRLCDSCKATAMFESGVGVQYCYQCLYLVASFMGKRDLLESNPLCELLFDGVWRTTDSTYEVWYRTPTTTDSSSQVWIQRQKPVDNSVDS